MSLIEPGAWMNLNELKWAYMSSYESEWVQTNLNEPKAKMDLNELKRS